jgi:hypothetical protein
LLLHSTYKIVQKCGTVLVSKKMETEGQFPVKREVICQVYSVGTVGDNGLLVILFLQASTHEIVAHKLKKGSVFT